MTKKKIAKKNLVIMYPSNHLPNNKTDELDKTPDESLNMTQLLFSPGTTEVQGLHSIFSPPMGGKSLRDVGTEIDGFMFSPISHRGDGQSFNQNTEGSTVRRGSENEIGAFGDHTFAEHAFSDEAGGEVHVSVKVDSEKENVAPIQQPPPPPVDMRSNPKTPAKTPSKIMDDSSVDSLGEFYTPCPKTPGTKNSKRFAQDDVSYESLNTASESREHLLSSFINDQQERGSREHENRWKEYEDESSQDMVFITPKQRVEKQHGENSSSEDEEFFSPLAQCPVDNDEGSSINLMREAKSLLAAKPDTRHLSVIQDENDEEEFFSPLAQHVPSEPAEHTTSYEDRFDQLRQNLGNKPFVVEEEQVEDGSTYRLIHDVKSILAASTPDVPSDTAPVQYSAPHPSEASMDFASAENSEEQPIDEAPYAEETRSPFNFQPTPTPEMAQSPLSIDVHRPSFLEDSTPNTQQSQLTPHLHSPSVSTLPPGALSVDFVKRCDCVETLKTILAVLNGSKKGKQLRQPRLVQFVQKRLLKLGYFKDTSVKSKDELINDGNVEEEQQWQQFQHESEWNVKLPPRVVGRRFGGKRIAWSEDVKDNAESSVASISLQSSLSFESIIQESNHDISIYETAISNLTTPKVVVTDLPVPTSSPSIHLGSVAESSLDMNLSESFTLGDESAYWKMGIPEEEEEADEDPADTPTQREVELSRELDEIRKAYEEAKADVTRLTVLVHSSQKQKVRPSEDFAQLDVNKVTLLNDFTSKTKASPNKKQHNDKLEREVEAARLANRALANTLAVSEKDLADAIEVSFSMLYATLPFAEYQPTCDLFLFHV